MIVVIYIHNDNEQHMSIFDLDKDFNVLLEAIKSHYSKLFPHAVVKLVSQVYDDECIIRCNEDINWDDILDHPGHWSVYWRSGNGFNGADRIERIELLFAENNYPYSAPYCMDNGFSGGAYVESFIDQYMS